jgi:hypothetical protein
MAKKSSADAGPSGYKAYAGNKETRDELKAWLASGQFAGLVITGGWDPKEEWGSWGIEFTYADNSILKIIKKECVKKGCVAERADAETS